MANNVPEPEREPLLFASKLFRYVNAAAVISLAILPGMLALAMFSVAPPD